jgi:1,4-dihydroxy-6-naphthoate synthase
VLVRVGHSPDPDDAFMVWALASGRVDTDGFTFERVPQDIQTLNEWALEGRLEVTALSLGAFPFVADRYALLPHGASMGMGYGPVVVALEDLGPDDLRAVEVAVPGRHTTALLALRLRLGTEPIVRTVPFDRILDEVRAGGARAGLVIHEGQLTYSAEGFRKVVDLGEWWLEETGLPLPLGVTAIRRDLGEETARRVSAVLRESIELGLTHRDEALAYALEFGRGLDERLADRFVDMYVNGLTRDLGERGRRAVLELLRRGAAVGAFPYPDRLELTL